MAKSIAKIIEQLQQMTVKELRRKWEEVFGEPSRSNNKTYLWKRIAWRIQVNREGGLSQRAKRRIKELARESDLRVRPPKDFFDDILDDEADRKQKVKAAAPRRKRDPRLPAPGTVISRQYKGQLIVVTVLETGFEYDGRVYRSLSAISKEVTGSHWNGLAFFNLTGNKTKTRKTVS